MTVEFRAELLWFGGSFTAMYGAILSLYRSTLESRCLQLWGVLLRYSATKVKQDRL